MIHFLTHPSHRYTRSNDWLQREIRCDRVIYADRRTLPHYLESIQEQKPSAVVLFQNDHLAGFIGQICPVLVVPMFDHARNVPLAFYETIRAHSFVNFSLSMQQRLENIVRRARYFQYAPSPIGLPEADWSCGIRVYFWERNPDEIDATGVRRLFPELEKEFIYTRPFADSSLLAGASARRWSSRASYLGKVARHNVFVAPRRYEGIGLAFLEAMAMGMCVYAFNSPTANEYIRSGQNGVLFNPDGQWQVWSRPRTFEEARRMGKQARRDIQKTHMAWKREKIQMKSILAEAMAQWSPSEPALLRDRTYRGLMLQAGESTERARTFWAYACRSPRKVFLSEKSRREWKSSQKLWTICRNSFRHPRKAFLRLLYPRNVFS